MQKMKEKKLRQLRQMLSQNYEHLEKYSRDNTRLTDELVEKTGEVNAVRRAVSVTQHQNSNMRNHFHLQGTSLPVYAWNIFAPATTEGITSRHLPGTTIIERKTITDC